MEKREKVLLLSSIILVGFVIGVIFHYILGFYFGLPEPYKTFLCNSDLIFVDFNNILYFLKNFAPYKEFPNIWINYFPLAYIILFPFTLIKNLVISHILFISIFLSFYIYMNIKFLKCKNLSNLENFQSIFIITFLTYPFLCLLISSNFDMFLFILITIFIYAFKEKKYLFATIMLAISNAIKPLFLIFTFLFLFEKKWKEFFLSLTLTVFFIIGGFFVLKGGFLNNIHAFIINLELFKQYFIDNTSSPILGSSDFFLALKYALCTHNHFISISLLKKIYAFISFFTGIIILLFTLKEKIFWKKTALMIFYLLTMSFVILDYKLIFLFIPLWLFMNTKEKTNFDLIYIILFGLLFIPKKYILIGFFKIILCSKTLNPLIMLIFMGLIIFEQLKFKKEVNEIGD
ncbi:MAG: hypothetical protein PHC64_00850 [Candidatus Gastranaerophilales bacterium]|nr:hypothetical protein [Candidatus Gastranaerophilales bacterium]